MIATVYHNYGSPDVLKCEEIEKPVPKDSEVLIKVRAAAVNPLDWRLCSGHFQFFETRHARARACPTLEGPREPGGIGEPQLVSGLVH